MALPLIEKIRYAKENEAEQILLDYIQAEENKNKVKTAIKTLLKSPENKVRRAVLRTLKNIKFADKDIIIQLTTLTKDDPEKTVRDLAIEAILEILKSVDDEKKKEYLSVIVRLMAQGKAMIDITDIVKSIGIDFAKSLLDGDIDAETKEYIKFAIEYLESES